MGLGYGSGWNIWATDEGDERRCTDLRGADHFEAILCADVDGAGHAAEGVELVGVDFADAEGD
jgi:hypothetical protein